MSRRRWHRRGVRPALGGLVLAVVSIAPALPASAASVPFTWVKGTVTGVDTGGPVAGVYVGAFDSNSGDPNPVVSATTDSAGAYSFRLRKGYYNFQFWPGTPYIGKSVPVAIGAHLREQVDAVLGLSGRIAGTVTDAQTGQPVEGVCVWSAVPNCTDAQGHYAVESVAPTSDYTVIVGWSGSPNQDYDGDLQHVAVQPGQTSIADFALQPRGRVLVTVHGSDGQPLEGAWVVTGRDTHIGGPSTDAGGQFLLHGLDPGPDGTALVSVTPPASDTADAGTAVAVPVQRGQTTTYDVTLPAVAHLAVQVHHPDGSAFRGDCLEIEPVGATQYHGGAGGCTDAADAATFDLAPGSYTYRLINNSNARNEPDTVSGSFDLVSGANDVTVDIPRLPLGTVTGVVTDQATGLPVAGVTVDSSDNAVTTTGADGRYTLVDVGRDGPDVIIRAFPTDSVHGMASAWTTVVPNGTVTLDLALPLAAP